MRKTLRANNGGYPVVEILTLGSSRAIKRRVIFKLKHFSLNPLPWSWDWGGWNPCRRRWRRRCWRRWYHHHSSAVHLTLKRHRFGWEREREGVNFSVQVDEVEDELTYEQFYRKRRRFLFHSLLHVSKRFVLVGKNINK